MVKMLIKILVIVNGDIMMFEKVKYVFDIIGVDGIMIGCVVQGCFWLFCEIEYYLNIGEYLLLVEVFEIYSILFVYFEDLYVFYGLEMGFKVVCKYIFWYIKGLVGLVVFCKEMNVLFSIE